MRLEGGGDAVDPWGEVRDLAMPRVKIWYLFPKGTFAIFFVVSFLLSFLSPWLSEIADEPLKPSGTGSALHLLITASLFIRRLHSSLPPKVFPATGSVFPVGVCP